MSWSGFGKALVVLSAFPWMIFAYAVMYMDEMGLTMFDTVVWGSIVVALLMMVAGLLLMRKK